jgi:hypothetical protein
MYVRPPLVLFTSFTTNAVINTDTTTIIIPGPGAGLANRVVGIKFFANQSVTGVVRLAVQGATFGFFYGDTIGALAAGGGSPAGYNFPEPGILLPANDNVSVVHAATVVSQAMRVAIYYYIDTLT